MVTKNKKIEKLVILAGGMGSRFIEETVNKPKPMIKIGGMPIIFHIMKYYSKFGIKNFIICSGYKGEKINEFFNNFQSHYSNIRLDFKKGTKEILDKNIYDWNITIIRSDENTNTGGRLLSIKNLISENENFLFTYGDGLSDINIKKQINYFNKKKYV